MSWSAVGDFLKANAGKGVGLVGSLLTGNIPGAIASGMALVKSATGADDPDTALAVLQNNPEAMLRLKELQFENEQDIRDHLETMARVQLEEQAERTKRHDADMKSDSWLSKNIRPGSLLVLLAFWILLTLIDSASTSFAAPEMYVTTTQDLLEIVFGFYFVSRGVQHVAESVGKYWGR